MNFRKILTYDLFSLVISNFITFLFPLFYIYFVIELFGLAGYGNFQYLILLGSFINLLALYGYPINVPIIPRNQLLPYIIRTKLKVSFYISAFFLIILIIYFSIFNYDKTIFLLILAPVFLTESLMPTWLFQIYKRFKLLSFITIIKKSITFFLLFFMNLFNFDNFLFFISIYSLSQILIFLISFIYFFKPYIGSLMLFRTDIPIISELKLNFKSFLNLSSTSLFSILSNLFFGLVLNPTNFGIFVLADKVVRFGVSFVSPLHKYFFPKFIELYDSSFKEYKKLLILYTTLFGIIFFVGSLLIFSFPETYLPLISNAYISEISIAIRILSPLPFLIFLNNTFGSQGLILFKKQNLLIKLIFFSGLLFIVFGSLMSYFFNYIGLAIASLTIEFIFCCMVSLFFVKMILNYEK